jgi:hypothetical protein
MNRIQRSGTLLALGIALASTAHAGDGSRLGLVLAAGLGPAVTRYSGGPEDVDPLAPGLERKHQMALASDVSVGYGLTERFLIQAFNRMDWHRQAKSLDDDVTIANGVTGIGVAFYTYPLPPTAFVTFGAGLATWGAPFDGDVDAWKGPGATAGLGYEVSRLWSVEGTAMWGRPRTSGIIDAHANAWTLLFTLNATAQ